MAVDGSAERPVVRIERLLPATPSRVWAAWTDPRLLGRWMSPVGHAEVTIDPRVGGRLHVAMVHGPTRIEHEGVFLDVDAPRRLRFSWRSPYTGTHDSIVTVELAPAGDQTRLVLQHERLPVGVVTPHEGGWTTMIDRLTGLLAATSVTA